MATRAATFTAKIRNLKDYHSRMINGVTPVASGSDIANTLKYFSQTLLGVLKDVPFIPADNCGGTRQRDNLRLSVFPNLNYSGLYQAVRNIIEVVRLVQYGQHALGESILGVIGCLVPFLETDVLESLPYTVATTLAVFPPTLHKDVVELLCTNLLPVTLGCGVGVSAASSYASESTAAILMLVFQYVTNGEYHSMLLECLMSLKKNVCKDLLCVIAYGPPTARAPAVNHFFFYWPQLNPALFDKRGIHHKFFGFDFKSWKPILCQREKCPNSGNVSAVKMCLDPTVATECHDRPPLYLCTDCAALLNSRSLVDILQPVESVLLVCENKNCQSNDNTAMCTCYAIDCASGGSFHPIRYCMTCHRLKHLSELVKHDHVYQLTIADIWSCDAELQGYLVEAIVSLLKEAEPLEEKRNVEMGEERVRTPHSEDDDGGDGQESDERKLLSRYGVWLLVELTPPKEDVPIEILGRLIAMLFQWFDATAYLPDDNTGNALNKLKPEYVCNWLAEVCEMHLEIVLSCLLPHPPEYAQVGGYCDTLASRTTQIKEGLNRLLCLAPYGVISFKIWDYVMAFWLEAIRTEVPEDERHELKVLICKAFDSDMSPLSFGAENLYHFISERFEETTTAVQEQCLEWLQILSALETFVPIDLLLAMFRTGISTVSKPPPPSSATTGEVPAGAEVPAGDVPASGEIPTVENQPAEMDEPYDPAENVPNIKCFIMMLDVLLKQIQIQSLPAHAGTRDATCRTLMLLLNQMLQVTWDGSHTCAEANGDQLVLGCALCELSLLWYQLSTHIMKFIAPDDESQIPAYDLPKVDLQQAKAKAAKLVAAEKESKMSDDRGKKSEPPALALAPPEPEPEIEPDSCEFPADLQLLHSLLKSLSLVEDADARYYWLDTLKQLCLHANCLSRSAVDEQIFVQYCLRSLMLPSLWRLLRADYSHVASLCVPILIHCLTQKTGADVFWKLVETDFNNDDWKVRFAAVEKVTVIARMLNVESIQNNQLIRTSLAHAFCYLIGSLDDINFYVVQRTALYLETIKASSIKCLLHCLEFQFDAVINDRTMILHKMFLMSVVLKNEDILTWDLFLNRFDTLCLEAQIDLENSAEAANVQDLHNSDRTSESFLRKINYARFALARTDSVKSVSDSLCSKPPYRRAASVPLHLLVHCLGPQDKEKDKSAYARQQSAPQFRSRGSRHGLSMFANYIFPGGHLREFTDGESNFAALLQRAMEMEGVDRETLHHLVSILMKFMAHSDQDKVHEDRAMSKAQNIVLRHLNVLLGYNQTEKSFSVPPYKLRYSAVFNAYIFGLAKVLDENFALGNIILPMSMILLQYCASPQRYASDYQPPNYSLWLLDPYIRQCWLTTLLVILYKYQYNNSTASGIVQTLVRITINTVEARKHRCKKQEELYGPSTPMIHRTRDTSNVSVVDLENIIETETPPQSPPAVSSETQPLISDDLVANDMLPPSDGILANARPVDGRRRNRDAGLLLLQSQMLAEAAGGNSPGTSPPSSPSSQAGPPASFSVCPLRIGKTFAFGSGGDGEQHDPRRGGGVGGTGATGMTPQQLSAAECFLQRQQDQVCRIAEYDKRDSLIVTDRNADDFNIESLEAAKSKAGDNHHPRRDDVSIKENGDENANAGLPTYTTALTMPVPGAGTHADDVSPVLPSLAVLPPDDLQLHSLIHAHQKLECVPEDVKESEEEDETDMLLSASCGSLSIVGDAAGGGEPSAADTVVTPGGEKDEAGEKACRDTLDCLHVESDVDESPSPSPVPHTRIKPNFRQRKVRKTGLSTIELQKVVPELSDLMSAERTSLAARRARRAELLSKTQQPAAPSNKQRSAGSQRSAENVVVDRCPKCHVVLESYDDETISLCVICLATFIHREPALAAPLLLDMLHAVARIASSCPHPWQLDQSGVIIPGNSMSVGRQFLRCVLHQLAPNNVFPQIFLSDLGDSDLLKTIAAALADFAELNCYAALQLLLEGVNESKPMSNDQLSNLLHNLATYLDCIVLESSSPTWSNILTQFDIFFRHLVTVLSTGTYDMDPVLKIMICVLKIPGLAMTKGILDPFSKLLSYAVQNCSFRLQQLMDICSLCGRAFTKDRDKMFLSRCITFELVQALKFKMTLPDENLILLVQLVCVDAGGTLGPVNIVPDLISYQYNPYSQSLVSTNAAECMRQHLAECVEFIADLHTISKVKNNLKASTVQNLNEDTLGSHLKAGIAQFVALEFTRVGGRDNRIINRYLPWLYHPPSAMQQGPREFVECVSHIRVLSWLLIGSLMHTAVTKAAAVTVCQPLSLEASSYVADHIMVILTGFVEQSKASVLHMSSLFHAFTLCQLWTMYCESSAAMNSPSSDSFVAAHQTVMDFWGRVTPGVLQLLSHSKVLAEMVNLHFLSLMEALQECNSTVLTRLFSMWVPILYSYHSQLTGHMQVRLQMVQNWQPKELQVTGCQLDCDMLLKWLKRLQFKLSQIEVQSSQATQFYTV